MVVQEIGQDHLTAVHEQIVHDARRAALRRRTVGVAPSYLVSLAAAGESWVDFMDAILAALESIPADRLTG